MLEICYLPGDDQGSAWVSKEGDSAVYFCPPTNQPTDSNYSGELIVIASEAYVVIQKGGYSATLQKGDWKILPSNDPIRLTTPSGDTTQIEPPTRYSQISTNERRMLLDGIERYATELRNE